MIRVPDFYYTQQPVDGYYEPPGSLGPVEKFRGETLEFASYIQHDCKPVTFDDWNIRAYVKTNREACEILWEGSNEVGIYAGPNPGTFITRLTSDETRALLPGTYWLYTIVSQKVNKGDPHNIFSTPTVNFCIKETYDITNPKYTKEASSQQSAPMIYDISKI